MNSDERKEIKNKAKVNLKKTYVKSILVMFMITVLMGGSYVFASLKINDLDYKRLDENIEKYREKSTRQNELEKVINIILGRENLPNEKKEPPENLKKTGLLTPIVDRINTSDSVLLNFYKAFIRFYRGNILSGTLSLFAALILLIIYVFIKSVLDVGKNRYFLEARTYKDTKIDKILFPYRTRKIINISFIIIIKNICKTLWNYTIIGGFIKHYEYLMIPYILAENPKVNKKEAFRISKEMMDGYKLEVFKLDISLIGWYLLSFITLGFSNIIYFDAYKEYIYAEVYAKIRDEKKNKLTDKKLLNDECLFVNDTKKRNYPEKEYQIPMWKLQINTNYKTKYEFKSYILIFFTIAFIGWCWEVMLHIMTDGRFVNRGTMYGPWLPIYGAGAVLILILLKRFRDKPEVFFLMTLLLAGIIEYFTAFYLENVYHMRWWNYDGFFLNINGRVCLEGLFIFGLGGLSVTYFIAPLLNGIYKKINKKISTMICIILIMIFGLDFIYSTTNPNPGKEIRRNMEVRHEINTRIIR